MPPQGMAQVLRHLPKQTDPNLLVGTETHDDAGVLVTDRLVVLGGAKSTQATVRLIEKPLANGETLRLAVTETSLQRLSTSAALALYQRRWSVERVFQELKEVLNLHRFYAANTNAVAMQVYTSAIVHTALRITQARLAREHKLRPEAFSLVKLFPRLAAAHYRLLEAIEVFEETRRANPGVDLVEPDWTKIGLYRVRLSRLLVAKRAGLRRKPPYSARRARFVSLQRYERRNRPPPRAP